MGHTYTNLLTHVIFSTHNRVASIPEELDSELHAYMGGIIHKLAGKPVAIGGAADHVHALIWMPAEKSISETVRTLKANSSRWIHQAVAKRGFAWQEGYGAFSVSQSNSAAVVRYIRRQREHHHKVSFQDEFTAFLKKSGIHYDERYVWG